ncbi:hypothetical protein [Polynucleobacter sp. Tro8-14-1]|uniref:hypothetical protein n=1 Tax=Polynucleobacter sp. Tro8-14-1 TaxID=1758383 RepID=UPI001C0AAB0F|nr:hypothetical protein [Polynucleobacter sp. Tro8-14-1]MBU3562194.1 hypothetical protein [Polynucleobacter sp. Tro8-14-1]
MTDHLRFVKNTIEAAFKGISPQKPLQPKPNFDLHFKRSIGCFILAAIFILTAFWLPLVKQDGSIDVALKGILILGGMGLFLCACVCMDRSGINPIKVVMGPHKIPADKKMEGLHLVPKVGEPSKKK